MDDFSGWRNFYLFTLTSPTLLLKLTYTTTLGEKIVLFLSPFTNSKPDNGNDGNTKSKDEADHDQDIPIVVVQLKSKELGKEWVFWKNTFWHWYALTRFIMTIAEMSTGTPWSTSTIWSPESTSFTERASRLYFRGQSHCNHRNTGGIEFRWRKKPAKVIWYNAESAERSMAIPPFLKNVPSKKF